jgi:ABC-type glutathione transport system ATPase component
VLLDDVLAALDVHTAKWIVDKCFKGDLLKGRTVLLVTHNVAMTAGIADYVVSLGVDGRVRAKGSVEEALKRDSKLKKEVAQEEKELKKAEKEEKSGDVAAEPEGEAPQAGQGDGKLIMKEEVAEGHVSWAAREWFSWRTKGYAAHRAIQQCNSTSRAWLDSGPGSSGFSSSSARSYAKV